MIIGITGGIGSGKSVVSKYLENKGYTLVDADSISREVTEKGSPVLDILKKEFGDSVILEDGSLNRKELARLAYATDENTAKLNSIVTSRIIEIAKERLKGDCVFDAPTLLENGLESLCDIVILVFARKEIRIKRVMARDGRTRKQILVIMDKQMPEREKMKHADIVVKNNGSIDELLTLLEKALIEKGIPEIQ